MHRGANPLSNILHLILLLLVPAQPNKQHESAPACKQAEENQHEDAEPVVSDVVARLREHATAREKPHTRVPTRVKDARSETANALTFQMQIEQTFQVPLK